MKLSVNDTTNLRYMARTGQPVVTSETDTSTGWVSKLPSSSGPDDQRKGRSYLGVPIQLGDEIIGFLSVISATPHTYTQVHKERLQAFADQAAIAIRNARLYEATLCHASELEERVAQRTAELEHERAQLKAILDSIGEGVIYDENLQVRYINQALAHLTGYSAEEWVGYLDLLRNTSSDETAWKALYKTIYNGIQRRGIWRGEVRLRRKDGSEFDAALTCTQVTGPDKQVMGAVTVVRDVSQEKALQEQKSCFVANAAHELRTPIANIITYLYLLRRQPERLEERLQVLETVSRHMKKLVDDMLEISRFEHGVMHLRRQRVALHELIQGIVALQQSEAERRHIQLITELPPTPRYAHLDPGRMEQVLTNLITNAIHYTSEGGKVWVRLLDNAGGEEYTVIQVQDNGVGIAPEHLPLIFEPFFRVDHRVRGTGLGLSIVKQIVELHNGEVIVESEPGRGTCFTIRLPSVDANDHALYTDPSSTTA